MSRYLLLLILTFPFIAAGLLSILTRYKLGKVSGRKFVVITLFWVSILAGLIFAESLYSWLFSNNLTSTESLSLFDVIQITAIVFLLFRVTRDHEKIEEIEQRTNTLHQEVSIILSEK